jgi:hypothetical protein
VTSFRHTVSVIGALIAVTLLASPGSGLYGRVVVSPAQPVCSAGRACTAPDKNDLLAFWRSGRRVATTRTDGRGNYRVTLRPGRYRVTAPRRGAIGRGLKPSAVVVPDARFARANFTLDVGIR